MNNDDHLFESACAVIPGGVNSPVRAFKSVGGTPVFIDHAKGRFCSAQMVSATLTTWVPGAR